MDGIQKADRIVSLMVSELQNLKPEEKYVRVWLDFEANLLACKFTIEKVRSIEKYRLLNYSFVGNSEMVENLYRACQRQAFECLGELFKEGSSFPPLFSKELKSEIDDFLAENRFLQGR